MESIITANGLNKSYKHDMVLKNVNIAVNSGEIYGLVGKNGAGKTTLMKILLGLTPVTSGKITLMGAETEREFQQSRASIGAMIETPAFYPYMSATENLNYYRIQRGIRDKKCVERALELVGLSEVGKKKYKQFSLGMKQRLGLALAILHNPKLLILDEPINGLDPQGIREVRELIRYLNEEEHVTVLISSHILSELSQLASRFGFINNGTIVKEVNLSEIEAGSNRKTLLSVDDNVKAEKILANQFSGLKYSFYDNKICFESECPDGFMRALMEQNVKVTGLEHSGESLEDYYIKLIGDNGR